MEKDASSFKVINNHFQNKCSEFVIHTNLNTSANLNRPYFAQISAANNVNNDEKIIAVKTSSSIIMVKFDKINFVDHEKLIFNDNLLDRLLPASFVFKKPKYFKTNEIPEMILGYKNGLIIVINTNQRSVLNTLNFDDKLKEPIKKVSPTLIIPMPCNGSSTSSSGSSSSNSGGGGANSLNGTNNNNNNNNNSSSSMNNDKGGVYNEDDVLVLFNDSTMMRYNTKCKSNNLPFIEKLKKFEEKFTFNKRPDYTKKTNASVTFGTINDYKYPQFRMYYARNHDKKDMNPRESIKFNFRTISDAIVLRSSIFKSLFMKKTYIEAFNSNGNIALGNLNNKTPDDEDLTILALATYDGYFIIYDYVNLQPILSFKSYFGGYNYLTFNDTYEIVGLGGHDDCITILDLNTLGYIKCEGHKSFVSKVIFQNIPWNNEEIEMCNCNNNNNNKALASWSLLGSKSTTDNTTRYHRIIGSSFDGQISVWEFNSNDFVSEKPFFSKNNMDLPYILDSQRIQSQKKLEALCFQRMDDAVGWIEIIGNMLIVCSFDGHIATYIIKDNESITSNEATNTPTNTNSPTTATPVTTNTTTTITTPANSSVVRNEIMMITGSNLSEMKLPFSNTNQQFKSDDNTNTYNNLYPYPYPPHHIIQSNGNFSSQLDDNNNNNNLKNSDGSSYLYSKDLPNNTNYNTNDQLLKPYKPSIAKDNGLNGLSSINGLIGVGGLNGGGGSLSGVGGGLGGGGLSSGSGVGGLNGLSSGGGVGGGGSIGDDINDDNGNALPKTLGCNEIDENIRSYDLIASTEINEENDADKKMRPLEGIKTKFDNEKGSPSKYHLLMQMQNDNNIEAKGQYNHTQQGDITTTNNNNTMNTTTPSKQLKAKMHRKSLKQVQADNYDDHDDGEN